MACQAALAPASLREVLKVGPLCRQRTLDLKKISVMTLNSTRPERGTFLILYRGAVVMPRCSSRAQSLPVRIGGSAPKDSTSSAPRYIFSAPVVAAPQPASPEPLGSQEPLALSRKVPLLVMPLVVRRAGTREAAAYSEVPVDRQVDGRCSCMWCGRYETSIIYKEKSMRP
jgi:hypothetical protein